MPFAGFFNAADRQREKAESRLRDESALRNGEVSPRQMAAGNSAFSAVDLSGAVLRQPRPLSF